MMDRERLKKLAESGDRDAAEALLNEAQRTDDIPLVIRTAAQLGRRDVLIELATRAWSEADNALLESASSALGVRIDAAARERLEGILEAAHERRRSRLLTREQVLTVLSDALLSDEGWASCNAGSGTTRRWSSTVGLAVRTSDAVYFGASANHLGTSPRSVYDWWSGLGEVPEPERFQRWAQQQTPDRVRLERIGEALADVTAPPDEVERNVRTVELLNIQGAGAREVHNTIVSLWGSVEAVEEPAWRRIQAQLDARPDSVFRYDLTGTRDNEPWQRGYARWLDVHLNRLSRVPSGAAPEAFSRVRTVAIQGFGGGSNPQQLPTSIRLCESYLQAMPELQRVILALHEQHVRLLITGWNAGAFERLPHLDLHHLEGPAPQWRLLAARAVLDKAPELRQLTVRYGMQASELSQLMSAIPTTLEALEMRSLKALEGSLRAVSLPALRDLHVRELQSVEVLGEMFSALRDHGLTTLHIQQSKPWGVAWVECIAEHAPELTSLSISGSVLTPEVVAALGEHWEGLTELRLDSCRLDAESAAALSRAPWLAQLKRLGLRSNRIDDAGVMALSQVWRERGCALRELDLGFNNAVADAGLAALAESGALQHMERLDLRENRLRGKGVRVLCGVRAPSLRYLDLRGSNLGMTGAKALAGWLDAGHLDVLDLERAGISPKGRELLKHSSVLDPRVLLGLPE